jgi:hypothetical protein
MKQDRNADFADVPETVLAVARCIRPGEWNPPSGLPPEEYERRAKSGSRAWSVRCARAILEALATPSPEQLAAGAAVLAQSSGQAGNPHFIRSAVSVAGGIYRAMMRTASGSYSG